jgi:hypothetical protein
VRYKKRQVLPVRAIKGSQPIVNQKTQPDDFAGQICK